MSVAIAIPPAQPAQPERARTRSAPHVEVQPFAGLDPDTIDAWRSLVDEDTQACLPLFPEALSPADDATVLTAGDGDGGNPRLTGLTTLVRQQFDLAHHLLPIGLTKLPGFRMVGNRILHAGAPAVLSSLVDTLADHMLAASVGMLEVEDVEVDSPLWNELHRLTRRGFRCPMPIPPQPHHRIRLPDTAEEYWSEQFNSKERSELRRRRKKLGEDVRVERYTRSEQINEFLEHAGAVSANTWQSRKRGIDIAGTAEEHRSLQFAASLDAWKSYILFREERPIAFALGYQWRGTYLYDQVGYDSEFVGLAPGKMLLVEILNDLFAENLPHTFDFGAGHLDYKGFFSNETTQTATLWVLPPGVRSAWVDTSLNVRRRLSRQVREVLQRTGLKELAHRIHRRGWRALRQEDK
ncbi:MAG: GNAT family N-acetyltransferase [Planctomycetaceae bacterium]